MPGGKEMVFAGDEKRIQSPNYMIIIKSKLLLLLLYQIEQIPILYIHMAEIWLSAIEMEPFSKTDQILIDNIQNIYLPAL